MLSFSLVAEALTGLTYHRPLGENPSVRSHLACMGTRTKTERKDSGVDLEANRRSTSVQSKSRFALPYSWPNTNWTVA